MRLSIHTVYDRSYLYSRWSPTLVIVVYYKRYFKINMFCVIVYSMLQVGWGNQLEALSVSRTDKQTLLFPREPINVERREERSRKPDREVISHFLRLLERTKLYHQGTKRKVARTSGGKPGFNTLSFYLS